MKTWHSALVIVCVLLSGGASAAQDRAKTLEREAKRHVGQIATLCGLVVAYSCPRPEQTTLLALERLPSEPGVSVAISHADRGRFGVLLEQRSVLREVCATGPVEKRKKRYLVRVEEPDQLSVRDGPAPVMPFVGRSLSACDVGVVLPHLLHEVKPQYTSAALDARIEGVVVLEALVLPSGQVGDIRVLRSLDSSLGLDAEATRALREWRFGPGTLEGQPVPVVVTVELSFRLK